jgi:hypothetical protein
MLSVRPAEVESPESTNLSGCCTRRSRTRPPRPRRSSLALGAFCAAISRSSRPHCLLRQCAQLPGYGRRLGGAPIDRAPRRRPATVRRPTGRVDGGRISAALSRRVSGANYPPISNPNRCTVAILSACNLAVGGAAVLGVTSLCAPQSDGDAGTDADRRQGRDSDAKPTRWDRCPPRPRGPPAGKMA